MTAVKPDWRANARSVARIYRWAAFVFAAVVGVGIPLGLGWGTIFVPAGIYMLAWSLGVAARERPAPVAVLPAPAQPITLAAPDSGPGQCRVCGMEDLDDWADGYVVACGTGRAHRDCEELRQLAAPVIETPAAHGAHGYDGCSQCRNREMDRRHREIQSAAREQREYEEMRARFRDARRNRRAPVVASFVTAMTAEAASWRAAREDAERARQVQARQIEGLLAVGRLFSSAEMGIVDEPCDCGACRATAPTGALRASVLRQVFPVPGGGLHCAFPPVPPLPSWAPDPRLIERIDE